MIESKGVDPIRMQNFVRLIMTSNEGWVVPAGKDERRFCVLDVGPRYAQNHDYFAEMDSELNNGGRERLLFDLQHFDIAATNLRRIPRTSGLLDQKIESLESVEYYWYTRLWEGTSTSDGDEWNEVVSKKMLHEDYLRFSQQRGERRRAGAALFGKTLHKLGVETTRPTLKDADGTATRMRGYALPGLARARQHFEEHLGQQIAWPETASDSEHVPI